VRSSPQLANQSSSREPDWPENARPDVSSVAPGSCPMITTWLRPPRVIGCGLANPLASCRHTVQASIAAWMAASVENVGAGAVGGAWDARAQGHRPEESTRSARSSGRPERRGCRCRAGGRAGSATGGEETDAGARGADAEARHRGTRQNCLCFARFRPARGCSVPRGESHPARESRAGPKPLARVRELPEPNEVINGFQEITKISW
jgi:hypothetical protein